MSKRSYIKKKINEMNYELQCLTMEQIHQEKKCSLAKFEYLHYIENNYKKKDENIEEFERRMKYLQKEKEEEEMKFKQLKERCVKLCFDIERLKETALYGEWLFAC